MKRLLVTLRTKFRRPRRVATYDNPGKRYAHDDQRANSDLATRLPANYGGIIGGGNGY